MGLERRSWELALVWVLGGFVVYGGVARLARAAPEPERELWVGLGIAAFLVSLAVGLALLLGGPPRERLGLGPGRLGAARLLALVVGMLVLSQALNGLLVWLDARDTGTLAEIDRTLSGAREGGRPGLALALLAVGIAPGVAEELLFRGAVQRALADRLGRGVAIFGAALLFAVIHLDPVHSAAALALGLYLGGVADLAGSVRPAMLCHVTNNCLAVVTQGLGSGPLLPPLLAFVLGAGLAAGILAGAIRSERRRPAGSDAPGRSPSDGASSPHPDPGTTPPRLQREPGNADPQQQPPPPDE